MRNEWREGRERALGEISSVGVRALGPVRLRKDVDALIAAILDGLDASDLVELVDALQGRSHGTKRPWTFALPGMGARFAMPVPESWPSELRELMSEALTNDSDRVHFLTWFLWDRPSLAGAPVGHRVLDEIAPQLSAGALRVGRSLQRSRFIVYEVQGGGAPDGLLVKDLVDGEEIDVHDCTLAVSVRKWDLFVARVIGDGVTRLIFFLHRLLPPHARSGLDRLLGEIAGESTDRTLGSSGGLSQSLKRNPERLLDGCDEILWTCAEPPELTNLDGEPVLGTRVHFQSTEERRVVERLRRSEFIEEVAGSPCADVDEAAPKGRLFVWLREGRRERGRDPEPRPVLGTLIVTERGLVVACNSRDRGEAFRVALERLLGDSVKYRGTVHTEFDQLIRSDGRVIAAAECWDALDEAERCADPLRVAYEQWLDAPLEPLAAFQGLTAREAVRSGEGREKVARFVNCFDTVQLHPGELGVPVFFDLDVIRKVLDDRVARGFACCRPLPHYID